MSRRLLGYSGLAALMLVAVALALVAASQPSFLVPASKGGFPSWLSGPLSGSGFTLTYRESGWLLIAAFAGYVLAIFGAPALSRRNIFTAIAFLYTVCFLAPPLFSADVFSYLGLARIDLLHGFNVYGAHGAIPYDQAQQFMDWKPRGSVYGPLFTLFSYLAVPFGLAGGIWFFKAVALLAGLGTAWLIWSTALTRGLESRRATVLVAANPVMVLFAIGGAHNDVLMMLITTSAIAFYVRERPALAGATNTVVVAMKLSAIVSLPYMLIADRRKVVPVLLGTIGAAAVVVLVALAAFGVDFLDFVSQLAGLKDRVAYASVPSQIGRLVGSDLTSGVAVVATRVALLAAICLGLFAVTRGRDWISMAGWGYFALLIASVWLLPWYLLWVLPFAALGRSRSLEIATLVLTGYLLATRVPFLLG